MSDGCGGKFEESEKFSPLSRAFTIIYCRSGPNLIADPDPVRNLLRNRSVVSSKIGFRNKSFKE